MIPMRAILDTISRLKGPIIALGTVGAVLSGFVGYWNTYKAVRDDVVPVVAKSTATDRTLAASSNDAGPLSIVVLPFASLSTDPALAYVAEGLTASITSDLSRIRDAYIVSATSALTYRDKALTAPQIGRDLGVRFVLQGNVQSAGAKIRVNAQLTDTSANTQIWSESFDGDTSDLFALQDKVTTLIGNSMGRELTIRAARESEKRKGTQSLNDLILRCRALALKSQSLENYREIIDLSRKVLEIDPDHVEGKLVLARHLALEAYIFTEMFKPEIRAQKMAEASALLAVVSKIDPENPDLPFPEQMIRALNGDAEGTLRSAERYLMLNPKVPRAYSILGLTYLHRGEIKRGTDILLQGLALDPKHPPDVLLSNLALAALMANDLDTAIAWGTKAKALNPTYFVALRILASAYALKGDTAAASANVADLLATQPNATISKAIERTDTIVPTQQFRAWFRDRMVPGLRLAGLPE